MNNMRQVTQAMAAMMVMSMGATVASPMMFQTRPQSVNKELREGGYTLVIRETSERVVGTRIIRGSIYIFPADTPRKLQIPESSLGTIGYEVFMGTPSKGRIVVVVLTPEVRRRGLGTKLVSLMESRMKALHVKRVAGTWPVEEAVEFWQKMGYTVTKDLVVKEL